MFNEIVRFWPGGPGVTLEGYFIYFKYFFTLLFVIWALGLLRWSNRWWLLGGSVLLAGLAWLCLDYPLGRTYAVADGEVAVFELAQPMVAAARGGSAEGWMVRQPNPRPLWSLALAIASGFDPERLLLVYHWIPLAAIVFLSLTLYWGLTWQRSEERTSFGISGAVAVFFVLFLSSNRLSFIRGPGPFWPQVFWAVPRLAFALGLLALWVRLMGGARRAHGFFLAGLLLGVIGWLEPRMALFAAIGVAVWMVARRSAPQPVWGPALTVALGLSVFVLWPSAYDPVIVPSSAGTWHFAVNQILALTLDLGLAFYLAVFALVQMLRRRGSQEALVAALFLSGLILWTAASIHSGAASLLAMDILGGYLQFLLAIAAGLGAHEVLIRWGGSLKRAAEELLPVPRRLRQMPATTLGLASLIMLSLPWCFPYWWQPLEMDTVYIGSLRPISRQVLDLAGWVRSSTEPEAVFVAGPSYAHWIAALTGRRVLLVEQGPVPSDIASRKRAESWVVESQDPKKIRAAADEWELSHFAWGRLDQRTPRPVDFVFF